MLMLPPIHNESNSVSNLGPTQQSQVLLQHLHLKMSYLTLKILLPSLPHIFHLIKTISQIPFYIHNIHFILFILMFTCLLLSGDGSTASSKLFLLHIYISLQMILPLINYLHFIHQTCLLMQLLHGTVWNRILT